MEDKENRLAEEQEIKENGIETEKQKTRREKVSFKDLLSLFWTFFKIGLFTFGGGYAMLPMIEKEIVEKKGWMQESIVSDMVAVAEATPGPIAVNMATFVGYQRGGFWGSFFSTLGLIIPSFIIILIISLCLALVEGNVWVQSAFKGIRAGVVALVVNAGIKMTKQVPKMFVTILVTVIAFALATLTKIDVVFIIIAGGLFGVIYQSIAAKRLAKAKGEVEK